MSDTTQIDSMITRGITRLVDLWQQLHLRLHCVIADCALATLPPPLQNYHSEAQSGMIPPGRVRVYPVYTTYRM